MADGVPLFVRRLRAALRRLGPGGARGIDGFVDGCVAGEIRGWAIDPSQPNRRVHLVAISDGKVVAETLADLLRADLVQDGRGDGRHAFRLRLPAALLDGERRSVQVRAIVGGKSVRLLRGEIEIEPAVPVGAAGGQASSSRAGAATATSIVEPAPAPLAMAVWPAQSEDAAPPSDWGALAAAGGRMVRLGASGAGIAELADAHTVIFARPGDRMEPTASPLLQRSRPLSDVLTWDGPTEASRRPEARPLGLLLGETLGGAFALRGHVFRLLGPDFVEALAQGDIRRAELLLAVRPELRWAHLPGRLTTNPDAASAFLQAASKAPPAGFRQAEAQGAGPARLIPTSSPRLLTLALWPRWTSATEASLRSLLAQAPAGMGIEVLAPAAGADKARGVVQSLGLGESQGVSVRAVDDPPMATPGAWLAALTSAASGDVMIVCQAGVRLQEGAAALEEIAAWAASPLVAAVTVPIRRQGSRPLSGLALERTDAGWSVRTAHSAELETGDRPVLAAPAGFLAIGRDKLALVGGAAAERLPVGGVDLDLCLRLRRLGLASVLLSHIVADADGSRPAGELAGAALAAFDPAELAAAAGAYPAPGDR